MACGNLNCEWNIDSDNNTIKYTDENGILCPLPCGYKDNYFSENAKKLILNPCQYDENETQIDNVSCESNNINAGVYGNIRHLPYGCRLQNDQCVPLGKYDNLHV